MHPVVRGVNAAIRIGNATIEGRWVPWLMAAFHLGLGFVVLGPATIVFGAIAADGTVVGVALFWLITFAIVLAVGLPFRLITPLRQRWFVHGGVTVIALAVGVVLTIVGLSLRNVIAVIGWFTFAAALLHLVWPTGWMPPSIRAWWIRTQGPILRVKAVRLRRAPRTKKVAAPEGTTTEIVTRKP